MQLLAAAGVMISWLPVAQEAVNELRWSDHFVLRELSAPTVIDVPASRLPGFFFPYYLYIPKERREPGPAPAKFDFELTRIFSHARRPPALTSAGETPPGIRAS
jgi:hypothetical protein